MKNNARTTFGPFNIINLLTKMWKLIIDFLIFFITFQNMLIQVLGFVERNKCLVTWTSTNLEFTINWICVFACLDNLFLSWVSLLLMKECKFGNPRSIDMLWMLEPSTLTLEVATWLLTTTSYYFLQVLSFALSFLFLLKIILTCMP
jgi:hypothetical protein